MAYEYVKPLSMEETTDVCGNWLKNVGERIRNLRNVLNMWKMTQIYVKCLKQVGNGLDMWKTASVCEK